MQRIRLYLLLLIWIVVVPTTHADIYQWQDNTGSIIFGNKPPSGNDTVTKVLQRKRITLNSSKNTSQYATEQIHYQSIAKIFHAQKRDNLIYEEKSLSSESRIISVRLVKEEKHSLSFDVAYYLQRNFPNNVSIGVYPNMDNWTAPYVRALPGHHTVNITVKLNDDIKTHIRTSLLSFKMNVAVRQGELTQLYTHELPFNKIWFQ